MSACGTTGSAVARSKAAVVEEKGTSGVEGDTMTTEWLLLLLRTNKPAAVTENINTTPAATPTTENLICFRFAFTRGTDGVSCGFLR